jgi:hypothetical protein
MFALRQWFAPCLVVTCFASSTSTAISANLTLLIDSPSSAPLVITPLDSSRQLLVSVVNDTSVDPPTEFMSAWQFWLQAIPDASTTGTLKISGGTVPDNYVFAGAQHLGLQSSSLPGDPATLNVLDLTLPDTPPVQISSERAVNLASISLAPSPDGLGRFGIYVVDLHTLWVDSSNSGGLRTFVNVPRDDGKVRIGDVLVVPEPATLSLLGIAMLVGTACFRDGRHFRGRDFTANQALAKVTLLEVRWWSAAY